jgi:hypothetical protein
MIQPQNFVLMLLALYGALFLLGAFVTYMFYARLRDIGDELRKFRIAYEFANPPKENRPRLNQSEGADHAENLLTATAPNS